MTPRTPFAAVVLFALGCTARASGGGGGPLLDTDAGNGGTDVVAPGVDVVTPGVDAVTPVATCDTLCARLTGVAGCTPSSVAACVAGCQQLAMASPTCQLAAAALRACVSTAAVSCSAPGLPFAGCDAQLSAYGACLGGGVIDSGVVPATDVVTPGDPCATATTCAACASRSACGWCDDRCSAGTSAGPVGRTCQRNNWVWTSGACANPVIDSGINNPLISGACQTCALTTCMAATAQCLSDAICQQCLLSAITPNCRANPNVAALITCACRDCRGTCGVECASLGL
jgi:hypothetical protein